MTAFAKEYGSALYQLAAEEGLDTELLQESAAAAALFRDNPDYMELLSTPVLPRQQRLEIADEAFRGRVHPYLLNFIKILLERGAVAQFPLCCEQFEVLYNRAHGIEKATAVTAAALSESLQQKLRERADREKMDRISELTRISRERPLTAEETAERQQLRQWYLQLWRKSVMNTLNNTYIEEADGTRHALPRKPGQ